ncbi:DUF262 domain-containing protein [Oxalobacteraceae sp. CFBP 13708]|jgi:hypothetical protein|nr:DUF262 domain-containing protein [Oxalobacteraceae sp. CFBP 13708]
MNQLKPPNPAQSAIILERFLKAQDRLVYQTADLSLGSLSSMTTVGANGKTAIDLAPDFQRRERWSPKKQSALIESFLLNVPVPPVYLAEDAYGQYSVVDGKQRLTAIHAFMVGGLRLKSLEYFREIEDFTFAELPEDLQNALAIRPYVRVVTLLKQSDPNLKFEVFTRLNRGGEAMLPQELRKVAYRGAFSDMIFEVAEEPFIKDRLKISSVESSAYVHMDDAEYVLRYFTLRERWDSFSGSLRDELDECMIRNSKLSKEEVQEKKQDFLSTLQACQHIWGSVAFQRHTGSTWRDQFLAGMYDAEMIAVSLLDPLELDRVFNNSEDVVELTAELFRDPEFDRAVRQGTNTPSFVRHRIDAIHGLLLSI